jgi:CheY-like chemotaxis protein
MTDCVDILLAEDDVQVRRFLRHLLEQEGYSIAEAGDGPSAVDLARRHRPRCVLVDIGIPGMDGLAVTRALRRDPRTSGTHIHCLTGNTDAESREQAHQAGCEEFLTKPVQVRELLSVVGQLRSSPQSSVGGLGFTEAQDLLDWLERKGCTESALDVQDDGYFAVRCTCPSGLQLRRDLDGSIHLAPL